MNILYLINGLGFSLNTGIGGSDKRAIEIIRSLKSAQPKSNFDILTTDSGYHIFKNNEKIDTKYYVIYKPFFWPSFINKYLIGRVFSYFYALIKSLIDVNKFRNYDAYFATSDFFFDVIPGYFYKKVFKKKLICMIHHYIKDPKARHGSVIINTLMYYSQKTSFALIKMFADELFLYDTDEGRNIQKIFFNNSKINISYVKNGIDNVLIDKAPQNAKVYEACFLGGLRHSKGIMEFGPLWKIVISSFPKARFLIIGGGSQELVDVLKKDISKYHLDENVIFTGPLSGTELYSKIKASKLFLFPSHEEGWGIALCEAMYCGLPIVCYDLPAYKVFGNVLDKYEMGNYMMLADKVVNYLKNENKITEKKEILINTAKLFTWDSIAKEEFIKYKNVLNLS